MRKKAKKKKKTKVVKIVCLVKTKCTKFPSNKYRHQWGSPVLSQVYFKTFLRTSVYFQYRIIPVHSMHIDFQITEIFPFEIYAVIYTDHFTSYLL